jgi:hypothetical protein
VAPLARSGRCASQRCLTDLTGSAIDVAGPLSIAATRSERIECTTILQDKNTKRLS